MQTSTTNEIFNLCDYLPSPTFETIEYTASLIQIPAPVRIPFEKAKLFEVALKFYASNRRVKNDKMKQIPGVSLLYPTYFEGLKKMYIDSSF